jgi:hypothetical protein
MLFLEINYVFNDAIIGRSFSAFVAHSKLYPPSNFVKNDTITICCDIKRSVDQSGFNPIELDTTFNATMWILYNQGAEAEDCTIQIGEENFRAINTKFFFLIAIHF